MLSNGSSLKHIFIMILLYLFSLEENRPRLHSLGQLDPCSGGLSNYVATWKSKSFIHGVDVTGIVEQKRPRPLIPLRITSAAALYDGATSDSEAAASSRQVFLIVDVELEYGSSYGHWVMEFAVFFREWQDILLRYPNTRIVIGQKRDFKLRMFDLYGISEDRIVLAADLPSRNYCIFFPFVSINDYAINRYFFLELWDNHVKHTKCLSGLTDGVIYYTHFQSTPLDSILPEVAPIPLLVMPRGTKENLKYNDRFYAGFEPLVSFAESHGGRAVYSDNVTDLRVEFRAIASARIIVVCEGSAYFANGAYATNAIIIVVGKAIIESQIDIPAIQVLQDYITISRNNSVIFVSSAIDVLPLIFSRFVDFFRGVQ
jgi:hypothetical protein